MNDTPFQGQQTALRAFEPDDADVVAAILNHPELTGRRYVPQDRYEVPPLPRRSIGQIIEKWQTREKGLNLAVTMLDTDVLIGYIDCGWGWDTHCPWLTVTIGPTHWRQGYGSDVVQTMLQYLFERTPAHVVTTRYDEWNTAARALATKVGFSETGRMRHTGMRNGQPYDTIWADILRREWQTAQDEGGT